MNLQDVDILCIGTHFILMIFYRKKKKKVREKSNDWPGLGDKTSKKWIKDSNLSSLVTETSVYPRTCGNT